MANVLEELARGLNRAWEGLAEGWQELVGNTTKALTRYRRNPEAESEASRASPLGFPSWALLPAEVMETRRSVVIEVEVPGVQREELDIRIENNQLLIRGEKHVDREHIAESYYLRERAYGGFERAVPLPADIDQDAAKATYRNGVLTVEIPKSASSSKRRLQVQ
jgi:HSP20 family protein